MLVAVNEAGRRIGEHHPRAVLTDGDVDIVCGLLDAARTMNLKERQRCGLTYSGIARKMMCSKSTVRDIAAGRYRNHTPARFKRVED